MVCCGAKLILKELKEQNFELTSLPEHVVIQINDTHPSMIIPELIRLLMEQGIDFDTATESRIQNMCLYKSHDSGQKLGKWPLDYLK